MRNIYFTGFEGSDKAYLGINFLETNEQIENVLLSNMRYLGCYRGLDNKVILENIMCFSDTSAKELFDSVSKQEESIYRTQILSKVKIGSGEDMKYLLATIYDLMCSLTESMQGFTVERDYEGVYYLLVCTNGEYIMNPHYKEKQDAIK